MRRDGPLPLRETEGVSISEQTGRSSLTSLGRDEGPVLCPGGSAGRLSPGPETRRRDFTLPTSETERTPTSGARNQDKGLYYPVSSGVENGGDFADKKRLPFLKPAFDAWRCSALPLPRGPVRPGAKEKGGLRPRQHSPRPVPTRKEPGAAPEDAVGAVSAWSSGDREVINPGLAGCLVGPCRPLSLSAQRKACDGHPGAKEGASWGQGQPHEAGEGCLQDTACPLIRQG